MTARLIVALATLLPLFCCISSAQAQVPGSGGSGYYGSPSWKVTLSSSGTVTSTTPSGTQNGAWNTGDEYRLSSTSVGVGQSASVSTSGTYYVTIQWLMPDGSVPPSSLPPPKNVIVDSYCNMGWGGPGDACTGNASNGLQTSPFDSPGLPSHYGGCRGEKYTVMDGSIGLITFSIPVSASVSGTLNSSSSSGSFSVTRSLSVSANSIQLRVSGTTPDTNGGDNILIGQGCMAGLFTSTPGVTFQNYHWTISGDTFKYYVAHGLDTGGYARVTSLTAVDLTQSSVHWVWRTEGNANVSISADVYLNNVKIGSASDAHPLAVVKPAYSSYPVANSIQILQQANGIMKLKAGPLGISWYGNVPTPPLFTPQGQGIWAFVQIITPGRSYVSQSGVVHSWSENGMTGLDTDYPYPKRPDDPPAWSTDDSNAGWIADGTTHDTNDSPGYPLDDSISSFTVNEGFETYLMYRPAGSDVQWVPLHRIRWAWNTNVNQPTNPNSWTNHPLPWILGPVTAVDSTAWHEHPLWEHVVIANLF